MDEKKNDVINENSKSSWQVVLDLKGFYFYLFIYFFWELFLFGLIFLFLKVSNIYV